MTRFNWRSDLSYFQDEKTGQWFAKQHIDDIDPHLLRGDLATARQDINEALDRLNIHIEHIRPHRADYFTQPNQQPQRYGFNIKEVQFHSIELDADKTNIYVYGIRPALPEETYAITETLKQKTQQKTEEERATYERLKKQFGG